MHDAVQAIDGRFEPYGVAISGAVGSREAAAASAAYHVLIGMYPSQANLTMIYNDYLNAHGLQGDPGLAVGQQVAAVFLALRRNPPDPLPGDNSSMDPGRWRPTDSFLNGATAEPGPPFGPPAPFAAGATPWLARAAPFTLTSPDQFRLGPPPALTSARYRREYNEVKALGARVSTPSTTIKRTDAQTDLAFFYADNFLALWYRTLRSIVDQHLDDIGESARLFALAALAAADSGIVAWDSKYTFNFWRPLTAIREGDSDGNSRTIGDAAWEPLLNTPNYPEHTSGANNLTGAMTRTLALFFGTDKFTFTVTSMFPHAVQKERQYVRFSDMAQDVVDVRIYQGIHFRTADEVGRRQGRKVARWVFKHFLRPVDDDHDDDDDDDHHER